MFISLFPIQWFGCEIQVCFILQCFRYKLHRWGLSWVIVTLYFLIQLGKYWAKSIAKITFDKTFTILKIQTDAIKC